MKLWLALFCALMCAPVMAAQTIDPRQYVDWSQCEPPYNQLVRLHTETNLCTAQYVAPDIVATAMHCIADRQSGKLKENITLENCHGDSFSAKIIHADTSALLTSPTNLFSRNDYALLRIENPQYHSKSYFSIDSEQTKPNEIPLLNLISSLGEYPGFIGNSAGWGALPILSDEDITSIKSDLQEKVAKFNNGRSYNVDWGVSPLYAAGYFDNIVRDDSDKLKVHKNCNMYPNLERNNSFPAHMSTCMIWAGNSGGAFYTESDNTLHGIASTSIFMLPNNYIHNNALLVSTYAPTREIYELTPNYSQPQQQQPQQPQQQQQQPRPQQQTQPQQQQQPRPQQQAQPQPQPQPQPQQPQPRPQPQQQQQQPQPQQPQPRPQPQPQPQQPQPRPQPQPQTQPQKKNKTTDISDENINNLGNNIDQALQNLDDMSDYDFLILLGNIIDYNDLRKQYEAAKAREQSLPNKLLGAAAIGATGIGGMTLASGLAEQSADAAAERDMRAYLATFRCDYGRGRNIIGGQKNIQLPGTGDLIQYTTEYKQLAAQLTANKAALGISPGIEAQVVHDSATTGLYDNVGIGKTDGAFTSLSRALLDENSTDAAEWQEQTRGAKNKIKTGTTITGIGAGGSAIGNLIINRNTDDDTETNSAGETPGAVQ